MSKMNFYYSFFKKINIHKQISFTACTVHMYKMYQYDDTDT